MISSTYDPATRTLTVTPNAEDAVTAERNRCLNIAREVEKLHPAHGGIARTIAYLIEKGKSATAEITAKGTPEWRQKCFPDGQC